MKNPYESQRAKITEIIQETGSDIDIKTFIVEPESDGWGFRPGQFVEIAVPGVGEAPFGFASSPFEPERLAFTIKRVGLVTEALHNLQAGDSLWLRGPFGNTFPSDAMRGHNMLFVAGGLGLAPLRPLIMEVLDERCRKEYGKVQMLLAARSRQDFMFLRDFPQWEQQPDTEVLLTIDREEPNWEGAVGFPHQVIDSLSLEAEETVAVVCGPPIMIKAMVTKLGELGLSPQRIFTTLEMRMSCGVGKCGKCNIGHRYVCVDGPVFRMDELADMPDEY